MYPANKETFISKCDFVAFSWVCLLGADTLLLRQLDLDERCTIFSLLVTEVPVAIIGRGLAGIALLTPDELAVPLDDDMRSGLRLS